MSGYHLCSKGCFGTYEHCLSGCNCCCFPLGMLSCFGDKKQKRKLFFVTNMNNMNKIKHVYVQVVVKEENGREIREKAGVGGANLPLT